MADGVHEVGFAQPHAAVDEQGVVGVGRGLGHRQGRRVGKAVAAAHHKGVEGILRVQLNRACRQPAGGRRLGPGLVALNFGAGQDNDGHPLPRHLGQAVGNQRHIAVVNHYLHGFHGQAEGEGVVFQPDRGQVAADPGLIGNGVQLLLQQPTGTFPEFLHVHPNAPPLAYGRATCRV